MIFRNKKIIFYTTLGIIIGGMVISFIFYKLNSNIGISFQNIGILNQIIGNKNNETNTATKNIDLLQKQNQEKINNATQNSNISLLDKNKGIISTDKNGNTVINDTQNLLNSTSTEIGQVKTHTDSVYNNTNNNKSNIYIMLNNDIAGNEYNQINEYITKAALLLKDKITFYIIKSKQLTNNTTCEYGFRNTNINKNINIIDKSDDIIYSEAIKYFNKIKTNNNDKLVIFNKSKLNINCNDIETVKKDIDNIQKNNTNTIIFNIKNINDINKSFFNDLSLFTGINNVDYNTDIELRNKLNDYIYPIENKLDITPTANNQKNNTYIQFLDSNNHSYQGELTIFKQEGGIFQLFASPKLYTNNYISTLDAGIYQFLGYDQVNDIYIETEPIVINKIDRFEYKFIFRKTKLHINILDENNKPILGNIRIKGIERKNINIKNFDNVSSIIYDAKPGSYDINIKTANNFIFNDKFVINGEGIITKEYSTVKQKIKITIVDQDNVKLNSALVIIKKDNKVIDSGKGNDILFQVPLGTYSLYAIDDISGNNTISYINLNNIDDLSYTKNIKVSLESYPIKIDLGTKGVIVKLYMKDFLNKEIKTLSGTGIKDLMLSKGSYILKVYNIKNEFLYDNKFNIDGFSQNIINIDDN